MRKLRLLYLAAPAALIMAAVAVPWTAEAKPLPPVPPGGLTAKIIATSGQEIHGNVNATGYDIGIYIGPGVRNVRVEDANISGASEEGILAQHTSNIVIEDSTIHNNGIHSHYTVPNPDPTKPPIQVINEGKAIELAGTSNCLVKDNIVQNNNGDGGIGLSDYGPVFPALPFFGAPNTTETVPVASTGNVITGNTVNNNLGGCGIVMSAWNPGAGLAYNIVSNNTLNGGVGGIIVAADLPNTTAKDNMVLNNKVTGSAIMGVIVHSNAPGDVVSGTKIIGNMLSNDGNEGPPFDPTSPTGIAVVAEVPGPGGATLTDTQVFSNRISNETFGVWVYNATDTHIANLHTDSSVTTPVSIQP